MVTTEAEPLATGSGVKSGGGQWGGSRVRTTRVTAKRAFEEAGIKNSREQMSLMEVHNCFHITELVAMEDLFVSAGGRATHDILNSFFDRQSQGVPRQVDGGLNYFDRPIGTTGLRAACEIHIWLLGRAAKRWLDTRSVGLLHNASGTPYLDVTAVAILGLHT